MFGNDSAPSKIYNYGASAPTGNAQLVNDQMFAAHRYRNALVEQERKRRELVQTALLTHTPDLQRLETEVADAEHAWEAKRDEIRKRNAAERKRTGNAADRDELTNLRDHLKTLRAQYKTVKAEAWDNEALQAELAAIDTEDNAARKALRASCNVFWGSYLAVEQSMQGARKGAPPKFHRWTGEGKLAVQIQGGMSVEEATLGSDTRLRIRMTPPKGESKRQQRRRYVTAYLRIGTEANSRTPIWATVPFLMHRALPDGCRIKWVYLIRRKIATHEHWSLQFVVAQKDGWQRNDLATSGTVGVDVGWRLLAEGLRVAYWIGDDGAEGQLILPHKDLARWSKAEALQSIRDGNFNEIRPRLTAWLKVTTDVPNWLRERTETLHAWRSASRLASVAIHWRTNRFAGDEEMFAAVEAWRKQDKHLYDWQMNQQVGAARWRDNLYREFAAMLRRRYRTASIEDINWSRLARQPAPEDPDNKEAQRAYQRIASVGRLLQLVRESMAETLRVDPKHTTGRCHACHELCEFDRANVYHTCEHCGVGWDQDWNAAKNLLAASSAMPCATAL